MIYANGAVVGLLVAIGSIAGVSGWALMASIGDGEAGPAWGWAALFAGSSLAAAWSFWRLM